MLESELRSCHGFIVRNCFIHKIIFSAIVFFFYHEKLLLLSTFYFTGLWQICIFFILQEAMLGQHPGLLSTDQLLLQQHSQIPVSISTSQGNVGVHAGAIQLETSHITNHHQNGSVTTHSSQNQTQMSRDLRVM